MFALFVNAGTGSNGNSRCGAIVFDDNGDAVAFIDDARSASQIDNKYPGVKILWNYVPVTASFVRDLRNSTLNPRNR